MTSIRSTTILMPCVSPAFAVMPSKATHRLFMTFAAKFLMTRKNALSTADGDEANWSSSRFNPAIKRGVPPAPARPPPGEKRWSQLRQIWPGIVGHRLQAVVAADDALPSDRTTAGADGSVPRTPGQ